MNAKIKHLNIEVTKRCNQRCFYCFNNSGMGSPTRELSPSQWLGILGKLRVQGLESVHLTGGEPFAYKHAVDILAGAQDLGLGTSILSNGLRVPELAGAYPGVFQRLVVAQISLDSLDEDMHNRRRGYHKAFSDAVAAIQALRDLGVLIEVSCVVSENNLADLQDVAEFCNGIDAGLIIRPMLALGRAEACERRPSFDQDLRVSIESLTSGVRLAADRFQYVADDALPPDGFSTCVTVHSDGFLRGRWSEPGRGVNLLELAA